MRLETLLLAAALTACGTSAEGTWTVDQVTTDGVLMSVWGTSPDDVWAVGGQVDRALVMHYDGGSWSPFAVRASSLLSGVYGFSATDVYAVGEQGLLLHFDGAAWQRIETGTDRNLFGIWGSSGDDVWIVGGDLRTDGSAVVLRGARDSFHVVDDLPAELRPRALFKVHGFAPDDVVMVGSDGVVRWNGTAWRRDPVPTSGPLFSTWGRSAHDLYAVGGQGMGEILHSDGTSWSQVAELETGRALSGVFTSNDGPTIAVGANSFIFELGDDRALVRAELPALDIEPFFHAVWGDGEGTTYTVGGELSKYPQPMSGVILRRD